MEGVLIRTIHHVSLGIIEYYLITNFSDEFPGVEMFGVGIKRFGEDESFAYVENVDIDKNRMAEFINCLADGAVTEETLTDLCENYVEMLTDRS